MRRNKINKKKIFKIIGVLLLLIIITAVLFYGFLQCKITEINIKKNSQINSVNYLYNQNYFLINEQQAENYLLSKNPLLKSIRVQKKFPNRLSITTTLDKSIAVLSVDDGFFMLSDSGKVIEKVITLTKINQLPTITFYQKINSDQYQIGDNIFFSEIKTALAILQSIKKNYIEINTVDINGENMIVLNNSNISYIFSASKDIIEQLNDLKYIHRKVIEDGKPVQSIDLRYGKPVIRY